MMWIDRETKLDLIVDQIIGFENDRFELKYEGLGKAEIYDGQSILREWDFEMMAERLKRDYPEHMQRNLWLPLHIGANGRPVSLRRTIDTLIDEDPTRWMGRDGPYTYSESDRQKIMQRCAEGVARRLKKYAKNHKIQYKIFDNGEAGFRYE